MMVAGVFHVKHGRFRRFASAGVCRDGTAQQCAVHEPTCAEQISSSLGMRPLLRGDLVACGGGSSGTVTLRGCPRYPQIAL